MLHIRVIKTKGNSRSVQVYYYRNGKRVIVKHIGSGTTDDEITSLQQMARVFIEEYIKQSYLFEEAKPKEEAILLSHCKYIGVYYTFLYDVLRAVQHLIGYTISVDTLLNDLVIMRVF